MLASLMSQTYKFWELYIFPNGDDTGELSYLIRQLSSILSVRGCEVSVIPMGELGRSPSVVYNRAQMLAEELLLCLDDDLWLPPTYLERMVEDFVLAEDQKEGSVVLSGVTPWSDKAFEGVGPEQLVEDSIFDFEKMIRLSWTGHSLDRYLHQNARYKHKLSWVDTDAISPANFMMRPSLKIPWSDCVVPSLFADVVWSVQLQYLGGYSLGFTTRAEAWHLNAPVGGLRKEDGVYDKSKEEKVQWERVELLFREVAANNLG
jgi:hypothetical protein